MYALEKLRVRQSFTCEILSHDQRDFVIVGQRLSAAGFAELRKNVDRFIYEIVPTREDAEAFYDDRGRPESG